MHTMTGRSNVTWDILFLQSESYRVSWSVKRSRLLSKSPFPTNQMWWVTGRAGSKLVDLVPLKMHKVLERANLSTRNDMVIYWTWIILHLYTYSRAQNFCEVLSSPLVIWYIYSMSPKDISTHLQRHGLQYDYIALQIFVPANGAFHWKLTQAQLWFQLALANRPTYLLSPDL